MGPTAASFAPQLADLLKSSNPDLPGLLLRRLEAWAPQQRVLPRQVTDLLKSSD